MKIDEWSVEAIVAKYNTSEINELDIKAEIVRLESIKLNFISRKKNEKKC
ncbi:MAG: hypothetical protein LBP54_02560 [Campylobacteraceae bacterium]|jgi:hypothetical protein|nr:hypothetical protein [Campylobacteraceae bacterium]